MNPYSLSFEPNVAVHAPRLWQSGWAVGVGQTVPKEYTLLLNADNTS